MALQRAPAPLPNWQLTFDHAVAATPLDRYQQLVDLPALASHSTVSTGMEVAP